MARRDPMTSPAPADELAAREAIQPRLGVKRNLGSGFFASGTVQCARIGAL